MSSFITVAASDLSAATQAQMPHMYIEEEVDTTGWPVVDVTNLSSIEATLGVGSCPAMSCNGTTDDSANFRCILADADADSAIIQLPAGQICQIDTPDPSHGNMFFRPDNTMHRRALRSSVAGTQASIRSGALHPDTPASSSGQLLIFVGENQVLSADLGWAAGGSRGDTTIQLDSGGAAALVDGDWLYIHADPDVGQPNNPARSPNDADNWVKFRAKVSGAPVGDLVTIDRPLPDDFTGANPEVNEWTPSLGWSFEDIDLSHENPTHQSLAFSGLLILTGMAEGHLKNVTTTGYQTGMNIENSARWRLERMNIDNTFDKPFNTSGIIIAGTSGVFIIDSIIGGPESFACAGNSQTIFSAFNYYRDPEDNQPAYDRGGGTITVPFSDHTGHGSTGACVDLFDTPTASGDVVQTSGSPDGACDARSGQTALYTHCKSSPDDSDQLGLAGSASCHGTRADVPAGSILLHNDSCSNFASVRDHIEGAVWHDFTSGPGRFNMFYGTLALAGDSTSGNVGIDNGGDWGSKYQGGAASPDYAMNAMLINGSWNTIGGGSANVLDAFMDGSRFEYNAMRAGCDYSGNDGAIAVAAGSGGCGTTATQPGWRFGLHSGAGSTTTVTSTGRVPVRDLTGLVLWNLDDAASCVVTSQTTNSVTCSGGLSGGNSFDATEEFAVSGDNITWTSNSVGIGTAAKDFTGISMPSAPGFTADPGITGGTGTFPYVGADQGGVTALSSQNCLPAYERYNGSC